MTNVHVCSEGVAVIMTHGVGVHVCAHMCAALLCEAVLVRGAGYTFTCVMHPFGCHPPSDLCPLCGAAVRRRAGRLPGGARRCHTATDTICYWPSLFQTYARYAGLLSGAEPVESCLGECFPEHLNAEVALHTVRDMDTATAWLRTTFLYIRVRESPIWMQGSTVG